MHCKRTFIRTPQIGRRSIDLLLGGKRFIIHRKRPNIVISGWSYSGIRPRNWPRTIYVPISVTCGVWLIRYEYRRYSGIRFGKVCMYVCVCVCVCVCMYSWVNRCLCNCDMYCGCIRPSSCQHATKNTLAHTKLRVSGKASYKKTNYTFCEWPCVGVII